jgi:hypothetical protein
MLGGDGGIALIDPTNQAVLYAAHPELDIQKSTDGGTTWSPITRSIDDGSLFVTPLALDPANPTRLWTGGY